MSFKVYNAYRCDLTFPEVYQRMNRFRDKVRRIAFQQICSVIDFGEGRDLNFWEEKIQAAFKEQSRLNKLCVAASACIYLHPLKPGIFLQFFGLEDLEMLRFPRQKPFNGIQGYEYTNQIDAPTGYTQKQWSERGKVWGRILENGSPSASGFVREFVTENCVRSCLWTMWRKHREAQKPPN